MALNAAELAVARGEALYQERVRAAQPILGALLKMEEAIVLADGALAAYMRSVRETGLPPGDPALERLRRSYLLFIEAREDFDRLERDPRWLADLAATGPSGVNRLVGALNDALRIETRIREVSDLLDAT